MRCSKPARTRIASRARPRGSSSARSREPVTRYSVALTRSPNRGIGPLVARELHELTGGAAAAVYLSSGSELALAGFAGPLAADVLAPAPAAAVRAFEESAPVEADTGSESEFTVAG